MAARKVTYVVTKPKAAELRAVKNYIVDKIIRWSQENDYCETVEQGLELIFGNAPAAGWRDSDGYNCNGRDVNGFDAEGYDEDGYGKDERDEYGYDRAGYDKDGYDRSDRNKDGYDRDGYDRDGYKDGVNSSGRKRGVMEELANSLTPSERMELNVLLREMRY